MRQEEFASQTAEILTSVILRWWLKRKEAALRAAAALMILAALIWLSYEFWRLLWQRGSWGAIDLRTYQRLAQGWFAGEPIYVLLRVAVLPPATYPIIWPLHGWLSFTSARWLWAATTVPMLAWLAYLVVKESRADSPSERVFAALIPFAMYATGAAIGNGQLIIHILPVLLVGILLLRQRQRSWATDLLMSAMILFAFVKPSISVPFFWIILWLAKSLRPVLLIAFGYAALTVFAASYQEADLSTLIDQWLFRSSSIAGVPGEGNVSNLHIWLTSLGLNEWIFPMSLFVVVALGAWTYYYREVDPWLLLGVTGYLARYWTYHRWYDDLLILLPMVSLFRIAKQPFASDGVNVLGGALLAITMLVMLAPGGLFLFPPPINNWYLIGQNMIWISGLGFLIFQAVREKRHSGVIVRQTFPKYLEETTRHTT